MNNPKIRFKGYTDAWEQRKLGDEATEILAGGDIDKEKVIEDGTYPIYANALTNDGIIGYYNDYYRVKAPAVTVTGRGEVGHAQARMTNFTPVVRLLAIRSNHDCYFLENAINNHEVIVESTGVPQLTVPQLSSYDICFPKDIEEEKKIGTYFFNLDHLITLHQRKCDQTKKLKKYMLQKMFPQDGKNIPEIRFEGFTNAWEQRKLGEVISDLKSGLSRQLDNNDIGLPVVRANNINDGKLDMSNDVKYWYVDDPQGANTSNYLIHKNDILVNFINSEAKMGTATIVETEPLRDTIYTTNILKMQADNRLCDSYFLLYVTMTNSYCNYIKSITKPAVNQASFTTVDYKNFLFSISSLDEQKKIGEYFTKLDHLITLHQRKCEELQKIKKYMLQNMFV